MGLKGFTGNSLILWIGKDLVPSKSNPFIKLYCMATAKLHIV